MDFSQWTRLSRDEQSRKCQYLDPYDNRDLFKSVQGAFWKSYGEKGLNDVRHRNYFERHSKKENVPRVSQFWRIARLQSDIGSLPVWRLSRLPSTDVMASLSVPLCVPVKLQNPSSLDIKEACREQQ